MLNFSDCAEEQKGENDGTAPGKKKKKKKKKPAGAKSGDAQGKNKKKLISMNYMYTAFLIYAVISKIGILTSQLSWKSCDMRSSPLGLSKYSSPLWCTFYCFMPAHLFLELKIENFPRNQ